MLIHYLQRKSGMPAGIVLQVTKKLNTVYIQACMDDRGCRKACLQSRPGTTGGDFYFHLSVTQHLKKNFVKPNSCIYICNRLDA
jgi:hypothetical protein